MTSYHYLPMHYYLIIGYIYVGYISMYMLRIDKSIEFVYV